MLVEGYNQATGQWIGRTSQNKTLNFLHRRRATVVAQNDCWGRYVDVRVTRAGPNSLAGRMCKLKS